MAYGTKKKYIGKIYPTQYFGDVVITAYHSPEKVEIKFTNTNHTLTTHIKNITSGSIIDPTVAKEGEKWLLGDGNYSSLTYPKLYGSWSGLRDREKSGKVTVDPAFYNFQSFCSIITSFPEYEYWVSGNDPFIEILTSDDLSHWCPESISFGPRPVDTSINSLHAGYLSHKERGHLANKYTFNNGDIVAGKYRILKKEHLGVFPTFLIEFIDSGYELTASTAMMFRGLVDPTERMKTEHLSLTSLWTD